MWVSRRQRDRSRSKSLPRPCCRSRFRSSARRHRIRSQTVSSGLSGSRFSVPVQIQLGVRFGTPGRVRGSTQTRGTHTLGRFTIGRSAATGEILCWRPRAVVMEIAHESIRTADRTRI